MTKVEKSTKGPWDEVIFNAKKPIKAKTYVNCVFAPPKSSAPAYQNVKTKADVVKVTGFSEKFINDIINVEKLKLKIYKDACGKRTIGIGHNVDADKTYNLGRHISEKEAYQLFAKDLLVKKKELAALTGNAKLNQGQQEALMDLLFHVGYGNLRNTDLIKKIKAGKTHEAVAELDLVSIDGKTNTGACKRRLQNIYDYSKLKPTKLSIKTMEMVKKRGLITFKHAERKASTSKKIEIAAKKELYTKECDLVINKMHKVLNKASSIKKPEGKSLWVRMKEFFFN